MTAQSARGWLEQRRRRLAGRWSRVLGIMSGTSLDGADFVLVSFRIDRPRLVSRWHRRFPRELRQRLLACATGAAGSWEAGRLHHDLGRFYAQGAQAGLAGERVDAVGLHGQTVLHEPEPGGGGITWQIGEPAYLVEALQVPVVSQFRVADMAAGGQGAPLATLFHQRVFGEEGRRIAVQNLGGIANVTALDGRPEARVPVTAFDTGPANLLMDLAVERLSGGRRAFDRDGRLARAGITHTDLVRDWLRHPFFARRPPKSTGREEFGREFLDRLWTQMDRAQLGDADRLATLAEFTAASVGWAYRRYLGPGWDRVILCGGGARNPELVRRLTRLLRELADAREVIPCTELGWPPEAVEGAAFALLARERLLGRPGNLPATTGARRPVWCGQISEPGPGSL